MSDLSSLIARLEKAEGPSAELDAEIAIALGVIPGRDWWSMDYIKSGILGRYTSSIDAAVSLAERVLPGFGISIDTHPVYGDWWDASIFNRMPMTISNARKQTGPLALCLATLRALDQKGSSNE